MNPEFEAGQRSESAVRTAVKIVQPENEPSNPGFLRRLPGLGARQRHACDMVSQIGVGAGQSVLPMHCTHR